MAAAACLGRIQSIKRMEDCSDIDGLDIKEGKPYVFGRSTTLSTFLYGKNKEDFNVLMLDHWDEVKNDKFVCKAFRNLNSGGIRILIGKESNKVLNSSLNKESDIQLVIKELTHNSQDTVCQFVIELLQLLCTYQLYVGVQCEGSAQYLCFSLTHLKPNANSGYWDDVIRSALQKIVGETAMSKCTQGGSPKKRYVTVGKRKLIVHKARVENGSFINMVKHRGFLVPVRSLKRFLKNKKKQ